ncbi:elongator complex protein 4 [Sigmodon hispidus]
MAAAATCSAGVLSSGCVASAAGPSSTTSFQRRSKASGADGGGPRLLSIAGTRPSVRNGQLLVSTGLPALDQLLGGGLAVGTVLLIEEDKYNIYSPLLFKYFLAEGIVNGHTLLVASAKEKTADILQDMHNCSQELPEPLLDDNGKKELEDACNPKSPEGDVNMKIAWRYQLLPKMQVDGLNAFCINKYNERLKSMPSHPLPYIVGTFSLDDHLLPAAIFLTMTLLSNNTNPNSSTWFLCVALAVSKNAFVRQHFAKKQKNILRIGIQNLGSPLWGDDICCTENCDNSHRLTKFLYILRGLLRTSLSACIITMSTHLIQNKAITTRVRNLSDTVVGLESFIGSERETNPLYKDYHGLIHIRKIPRLNNLTCDESDVKDLAFKLKRKLFTIERLHLPPDLSDTVSRSSKQDLAESSKLLGPGCGMMAGGKKHLDF